MTEWGWRNRRAAGARDIVPRGLKPLAAAVPWVTAGILFIMMTMVGGHFTLERGVLFALPESEVGDVADTTAVSLLVWKENGILVFFDDTRYRLDSAAQMESFRAALENRTRGMDRSDAALLAMADLRIMGRDLMKFAEIAKKGGVSRVLFAEKKGNGGLE